MPTTTYFDDDFGAFAIGARTDDSGAAVDDVSAEESRLINQLLTPGVLEPSDGWLVAQRGAGANMSVDVGSGDAKSDIAVVQGNIAGQGRYLVRKELATVNVTIAASHASLAYIDEVYLVVADAPYDSGSLALARLAVRRSDAGGAAPGPDAAWDAYLLLATISIPANDTTIGTAQITDERETSHLAVSGIGEQVEVLDNDNGYTLTASAADAVEATLAIPAYWNTWDCYVIASCNVLETAGVTKNIELQLGVDATILAFQSSSVTGTGREYGRTLQALRTGITTTGNRQMVLQAWQTSGVLSTSLNDITIYARAIRTS